MSLTGVVLKGRAEQERVQNMDSMGTDAAIAMLEAIKHGFIDVFDVVSPASLKRQ